MSTRLSDRVTASLPVTVAVPVKNEEANLAACLARLSCFAEIVVIDSGSTDRTQEISEKFGGRIVRSHGDVVSIGAWASGLKALLPRLCSP